MEGDGKWRTQCVGDGQRPFVVWRLVAGVAEYHRAAASGDELMGPIIRYGYDAALRKARELNETPTAA